MVAAAVLAKRVPHRERNAEVALAGDAPVELEVLRPVAEAHPHEVRVPAHPLAGGDQLRAPVEETDEPLPGADELERPVALLVELDRVLDRLGLADERRLAVAGGRARGIAQHLHDRSSGPRAPGGRRAPRRSGWRPRRPGSGQASPPNSTGASRPSRPTTCRSASPSSRHHCTSVASPKVQTIRIPVPFSRSTRALGKMGTGTRNSGVTARFPNRSPYRSSSGWAATPTHAGSSSGRVVAITSDPAALDPEAHLVEGAPLRPVLDLRLRHRGAEVHVPEGRGLDLVDVPPAVQVEEAPLRHPPAVGTDRRVLERPVDREPQPLPEAP